MANEGISIPASGGGLMRYNEDSGSKFSIKPSHVVALCIGVAILAVLLQAFF